MFQLNSLKIVCIKVLLTTVLSISETSLIRQCDYFHLELVPRNFKNCSEQNFIVDKLRNSKTREHFWCITFIEDNEVNVNLKFDGPFAIEARGIQKPKIVGNSLQLKNQRDAESVRIVVKTSKLHKNLPELTSLLVNEKEKCDKKKIGYVSSVSVTSIQVNKNDEDDGSEHDYIFNQYSCGKVALTPDKKLIANGKEVSKGAHPWHVAIYHYDENGLSRSYKCGGTILEEHSQKIIVTAAHCIVEKRSTIPTYRIKIKAGLVDITEGEKEFSVYKVIKHENYNETTNENDIALIAVSSDIEYSDFIRPICSPTSDIDFNSKSKKFVIGFGITERKMLSPKLLEIPINPITHETCISKDEVFFSKNIFTTNYCAEGENQQTACKGDSGSGSFELDSDTETYYLQGIVSFTKATQNVFECNLDSPVVFTNVFQYKDWISQKIDQLKN